MALLVNTKIFKEDNSSGTGIINQLTANDSSIVSYLNGGKFANTPQHMPDVVFGYRDKNSIASLFVEHGAVYVKNIDGSKFCKDKSSRPTASQIKSAVSNSLTANFDDLSAMIVNACVPLTNIRYSEIKFMAYNSPLAPNRYSCPELFGDLYLTDSAILSTATTRIMQNRRIESQVIIDTRDAFVDYGGNNSIRNDLLALRNDLVIKQTTVSNPYSQNSVDPIMVSTVNSIINLCIQQLNNIRLGLSCYFEDEYNDPENQVKITYWRTRDGSGNPSTHSKIRSTYRYDYETIIGWPSGWGEMGFRGWSTQINPTSVQYPKDYILCLDKDYVMYPVLGHIVKYHSPRIYTVKNSIAVSRPNYVLSKEKSDDYTVTEIVQMNTADFKLPSCTNYFNGTSVQSGYTFQFLGWKQKQPPNLNGNTVDFLEGNGLNTSLTINKDYTFEPIGFIGVPDPYLITVFDLCVTNTTNSDVQGWEKQQKNFSIKIPVTGKCSYLNGNDSSGFTIRNLDDGTIKIGDLGFAIRPALLDSENVFIRIKVKIKETSNTWKQGHYTLESWQDGNKIYSSKQKNFCTAETADNEDNFGYKNKKWDFYATQYKRYSPTDLREMWKEYYTTLEFDPSKPTSINNTYIKLYGKTGGSTAGVGTHEGEPKYPYRFRFNMQIVEALIGHYH